MTSNFPCPACGSPLPIKNRFVKVVTCDFCAQVSMLQNNRLDPTGKVATLAELPSPLYVDAVGTLAGQPFQAVGRLRYSYDAGQWDEWFVLLDGQHPAWLVEDEGTYKLYRQEALTGAIPTFEQIGVGSTVAVNGRNVFVVEKGVANILGSEGQLAFSIVPGEEIGYIDGVADGAPIAIEFATSEIEFLVGRVLEPSDVQVDDDAFLP